MGIGHYSMNIWWDRLKFRVNIANKRINLFGLDRLYKKIIFRFCDPLNLMKCQETKKSHAWRYTVLREKRRN